jgi:asparagine synthase (glutamine-hydrolysing)
MCGFCGIYDARSAGGVDRDLVAQMTRLMAERGPDEEGTWFEGHIGLGHRRLTIIDLSAGEQPVFNEDRSILVVFNGEIYNYKSVRADLERLGHVFRTHTDTEVIVHAWEEYGERCLDHLRGMFAFALFHRGTGEILLARDRLGVKPLYYAIEGSRLIFASEIKPLLLAINRPARANAVAVDFFMTNGYVPGEQTMFDGIRKLPPGFLMRWKPGQELDIRRYWDVPDAPALRIDEAEAQERLAALLRESIELCMVSDVPIGAFLSGGVDSSVVVANMVQLSPNRVKTFALGFEDSLEHSELPHARRVADHLGTDHTEHILRGEDFFESLASFVLRTEEPIVDASGIAMYHLAKRTRQDVTVVLSGEGGDEILAGYPIYRTMAGLGKTQLLRDASGISGVSRWLSHRAGSEKGAKYLDWLGLDVRSAYKGVTNDVTRSVRERFYDGEFAAKVGDTVGMQYRELFDHLQTGDTLKRMAYVDLKSWLSDNQLIKTDKMTMAASVELRVPLLDHKLVEYCLSLPSTYRLHGTTGKYLLKKVAERWLPKDIVYRKKQGFPTPIAQWFRGPLYERLRELLLDRRALERGYFRKGYVESVLAKHRSAEEDLSRRILTFAMLEIWHRTFVDTVCAPVASARQKLSLGQDVLS